MSTVHPQSAGDRAPLITAEKVNKHFGPAHVLKDVSTRFFQTEVAVIIGASGSGKSTFLRLLLREEQPTDGQIIVAGREIDKLSRWKVPHLRRNIGCVFQDYKLLSNKTVATRSASSPPTSPSPWR